MRRSTYILLLLTFLVLRYGPGVDSQNLATAPAGITAFSQGQHPFGIVSEEQVQPFYASLLYNDDNEDEDPCQYRKRITASGNAYPAPHALLNLRAGFQPGSIHAARTAGNPVPPGIHILLCTFRI